MICSREKERYFSGEKKSIRGTRDQKNEYIEEIGSQGVMFRYAEITAKLPGEPIEILQITDLHLNAMNIRDIEEKNPVIESTRKYRLWCRDGESVPNAERVMALSKFADQTVVTGDTLDYLTWGSMELMKKIIWDKDPETIVTLGGHDTTRKMQGKVEDPTSLEERMKILKGFWRHELSYSTKIIKDRVLLIQMDNGNGDYTKEQYRRLSEDLAFAREKDLTILLFQHEPICTGDPADREHAPLRVTDPGTEHNFYTGLKGDREDPDTAGVYRLITENADVIRGIFCGHYHNDYYTEICAKSKGEACKIPQYVLTGNPYDQGHVLWITVQ